MTLTLRQSNVEKLGEQTYDVLVVGGGINGAVSAASLAGRGVKVALIEREDFASGRQLQFLKSGVGRHQVPGESRVPAGQQAV